MLATEWPEFRDLDFVRLIPGMKRAMLIDQNAFAAKQLANMLGLGLHRRGQAAMKLKGRFALITGASQGLGAEIARHYVTNGASVMLCARSADKLAAAQQAPRAAAGVRCPHRDDHQRRR